MDERANRTGRLLGDGALALIYFLSLLLSLWYIPQPGGIVLLWPPSGVLPSILLLTRPRRWPGLLALAGLVDVGANVLAGNAPGDAALFAGIAITEAALVAGAVRWSLDAPPAMTRLRDVVALAVLSAPIIGAGTALLGAALTSARTGVEYWTAWRTWWISDVVAVAVIATFTLSWAGALRERRRLSARRVVEGALLLAALCAVVVLIFSAPPLEPRHALLRPYLVFPILILIAMRFGPLGTTTAALVIAAPVLWYTGEGSGPFAAGAAPAADELLTAQGFLAMTVVPALALAAAMAERTTAAAALRESEGRFRQLAENIHEAFWMTDFRTKQILYISPAYEQIWGQSAAYLYTNTRAWLDGIHPDDRARVAAIVTDQVQSLNYDLEFRVIRPDGSMCWVRDRSFAVYDADGAIYRLVGVAEDITRQKETEEALRASESRLRQVLSNAPINLWAADRDGVITLMEGGVLSSGGVHARDLVGRKVADVIGREDLVEHFERALAGEEVSVVIDVPNLDIVLDSRYSPMRDADGRITGVIGVATDITAHRRAEEALRVANERFRVAFEHAPLGMALISMADNRYLDVNPALCRFFGRSREELLAIEDVRTFIRAVTHPDDLERDLMMWSHIASGEAQNYQIDKRFLHSDGTPRWSRTSISIVRDTAGAPLYTISQISDTHEQKLAEEALRQSEERLQMVLQHMPVMLDAFDEHGTIIVWNAECERVTGYSAAEIVGNPNAMELLYPNRQQYATKMNEWRHHARERAIDWEIRCKDGKTRTVAWSSLTRSIQIPGWTYWSIGVDITERQQAAEQLTQYAERLKLMHEIDRAILSAESADAIAQATVATIRRLIPCSWVNVALLDPETRASTVLAVDADEGRRADAVTQIPGPSLAADLLAEKRAVLFRDLGEVADRGPIARRMLDAGIRSTLTVPLVAHDALIGCIHFAAERCDAFLEEHMEIAREVADQLAIAIQQAGLYAELRRYADELERRVMERTDQLAAAQAELLRQERLATLGRLTATVSHELRNPLGTLRASFFSIAEKVRDKGLGLDAALARIERSITRCDNIITELLDYTRVPMLQRVPVALDDWLRLVIEEQTLPPGVALAFDLRSAATVQIDPDRFRRVIINLFDNACQAMQAAPHGRPQELSVRTAACDDATVELVIEDSGTGIPPEVLPHIYEPLYSTRGFGIGLGLTIVQQIVHQHGGTIAISSTAGQGTSVAVSLPVASP